MLGGRPVGRKSSALQCSGSGGSSVITALSENQLEFRLHQYGPQQVGQTFRGHAAGASRVGQRLQCYRPLFGRWRASERVPVQPVDDLCRPRLSRAGRQRRSGCWRNQPIHIRLRPKNQEPPENRLALCKGRCVFEPGDPSKPGKPTTGDVVHEPRRRLDAHARRECRVIENDRTGRRLAVLIRRAASERSVA